MTGKLPLLFLLACLVSTNSLFSQSGCPGCSLSLPDSLAADTIYISQAPDGQAGVYYEGDLSFRLPRTTTPVAAEDPDVPPGLGISKITISGVSNVPPGLSWEPSQMEFNTAEETDGCVRFCGIPLQPGLYLVDVILTARVLIVDQTASVTVPILILPAESTTDGFSMVNNSGCGQVEVSFSNNVPSNGNAGFSYLWDFGNGNTATVENPDNQVYDLPGVYPVSYQALIDTTGYFLTRVNINAAECSDALGGRPDLKVNLFDPSGSLILVTDIITNAQTPLSFQMNVPLDTGTYLIAVTDADNGLGGADDPCGSVTFHRNTTGNLSDGGLALTLEILHPVSQLTATDTVFVYDQPDPPLITSVASDPLCEGDTVLLLSDYAENIQWYHDSVPVLTGTRDSLLVKDNGAYWVLYTSPDGCISTAVPVTLNFGPLPESVLFVNEHNELSLYDPGLLPIESAIHWYQNGQLLEGFAETTYCIDASGTYTIEVIDLSTGCAASYSQAITYDPDFPNCVSPVVDVLPDGVTSVRLFPNPTSGPLRWEINSMGSLQVRVGLWSVLGQEIRSETWRLSSGTQWQEWDLSDLAPGMYTFRMEANGQAKSWSIIRN